MRLDSTVILWTWNFNRVVQIRKGKRLFHWNFNFIICLFFDLERFSNSKLIAFIDRDLIRLNNSKCSFFHFWLYFVGGLFIHRLVDINDSLAGWWGFIRNELLLNVTFIMKNFNRLGDIVFLLILALFLLDLLSLSNLKPIFNIWTPCLRLMGFISGWMSYFRFSLMCMYMLIMIN